MAISGGNGTLNIQDNSTVGASAFRIGDSGGTGAVFQTGGTVNVSGYFSMGVDNGNGTANYTLSGGQLNDSGDLTVNENSSVVSTFNQTGGKVNETGGWMFIGRNGHQGVYNLSGGTLATNFILTDGTGSLKLNGGVLSPNSDNNNFIDSNSTGLNVLVQSGGAIIDTAGHAITINHPMVEDAGSTGGGLTKQGLGTLILASTNTYSGGTTVAGGTLRAVNTVAFGSGGLTVNSGTFDLNAQTLSFPSLSGTGGTITDNNAGAGVTTFTINQTGNSAYAGALQNGTNRTIAFKQNGAGTLSLSGNSTIGQFQVNGGGGLTLTAGTLAVVGTNTGAIYIGSSSGTSGTLTINSGV